MEKAPFFTDVADGPAGGVAHWLTTSDGLRIRAGYWPLEGAKGTVLLFTGRSEFIEKYGRIAREMAARGFALAAIDWRGQGLSDRLADDRGLGHVGAFTDYQHDVAAFLDYVGTTDLPKPYYLVAHSMGGGIGLRATMTGLPVNAAVFSAPMWGIKGSLSLRSFIWGLSALSRKVGLDGHLVPGQSTDITLGETPFDENELTNDPEMYAYMQNQVRAHPDLGLGGPSLRWVNEALWETRQLSTKPSPDVPTLTFLGSDESIVDPDRIKARMAKWPNGTLTLVPGGKHEMLMDGPKIAVPVLDAIAAHFNAHP